MELSSIENILSLEKELKSYILKHVNRVLQPDEVCFYQCPATAVYVRAAMMGSPVGGTTYKSSNSISQLYKSSRSADDRRNVAEKYPGTFFITNHSFILQTAVHGFELPLLDISIINFYPDGFAIMSKGRSYIVETLHANMIRKFLEMNMTYMRLLKEKEDKKNAEKRKEPKDPFSQPRIFVPEKKSFDFQTLKSSLDLLCGSKTKAEVFLPPPVPQKEPKKILGIPVTKWGEGALWTLALLLTLYFVFPLMLEFDLKDLSNLSIETAKEKTFQGTSTGEGGSLHTFTFENASYTLDGVILSITSAEFDPNGILKLRYNIENTTETPQTILISSLENKFSADAQEIPLGRAGRYAPEGNRGDLTIAAHTKLENQLAVYYMLREQMEPLKEYDTLRYVTGFHLLGEQGALQSAEITLTMAR